MTAKPKVSVIIPNYNHGQYLTQRIDSVLCQTFTDFELIILDDASTDGSREIIGNYSRNPHVSQIVFNDVNSGNPFVQWKRGLSLAKGEWIWIAESDDYADCSFLERMISALQNRQNVGLAYCDSHAVTNGQVSDKTFAFYKNSRFNTNRWSSDYFNSGADEIENYLLLGGTINNTSAVLFNRQIMTDVDPFDIPFRYIGDKYTFVKVLSRSNAVYVKDPLNYYRDPFNAKHQDRFVMYFYEQFLVFDWVYKNMPIHDKKKFFESFYSNTRNSLFRDWNNMKLKIYRKLFGLNTRLFIRCIANNLQESVRSQFVSQP